MPNGKKSKVHVTLPLQGVSLYPGITHTQCVRSHIDWQPSKAQKKNLKRRQRMPQVPSSSSSLKSPWRGFPSSLNFTLNSQVWLKSFTEGSITDWGMIHFTSQAPKSYLWGVFECIYLACEAFCKINMGIFQFDKSTWNITS